MSIISDVLSDIKKIDRSNAVMRKFGLVLGALLFLLGGLIWFKHRNELQGFTPASIGFISTGTLSVLFAVIYPAILRPINTGMLFVGMLIGWVVTRVILIFVFFFVFFPVGIIMKLFKYDSMRRKLLRDSESYWILREQVEYDPERSKRLF